MFDCRSEQTPDEISDVIADDAAEHSRQKNLQKTIRTKKRAVRHHAGQKQSNVAFDGAKSENRKYTVISDNFGYVFHS